MPSQFYRKVIALSKTPADFPQNLQATENTAASSVVPESITTVVDNPTTTVVVESTDTVVDGSETTVVGDLSTTTRSVSEPITGSLWCAEGGGGIFAASRIRRICRAQDALTHVEEAVYDILWGPKNQTKDSHRLAQIGYGHIAKGARTTKRNAALIVERLIEKGFVILKKESEASTKTPRQYLVAGYRAALEELERRGRKWVVRSGNGILFVHPLALGIHPATVVISPATTVVAGEPTTVAAGQSTTVVAATTEPVVTGASTTVVAATTPLDIKTESEKDTSSSSVFKVCHRYDIALDAVAARLIPRRCRTYDPAATDEEIAHFTEVKILQLRGSTRIGNLVGLLLTAVPEFFVEPAHEVKAYREAKATEALARVERERLALERLTQEAEEEAIQKRIGEAWAELSDRDRAEWLARVQAKAKQQGPNMTKDQREALAQQMAMRAFGNEFRAILNDGKEL